MRVFDIIVADLREIGDFLAKYPNELLHIPAARGIVAKNRYEKLKPLGIDTADDKDAGVQQNAVEKNLVNLDKQVGYDRPALLTGPLASIDEIRKRKTEMNVLSIGPHSEAEILTLIAAGFALSRIRGLDLLSYSPWVEVGDAHAVPCRTKTRPSTSRPSAGSWPTATTTPR